MEDELDAETIEYLDMARSGSITCLSKKIIRDVYENILTCVAFVSILYICLLILQLLSFIQLPSAYQPIGYISFVTILSIPVGFHSSTSERNWAFISFITISSIHLYALVMYIALTLSNEYTTIKKDHLHQLTILAGIATVILSIVFACLRLISITKTLDVPKVIVVDNNPID